MHGVQFSEFCVLCRNTLRVLLWLQRFSVCTILLAVLLGDQLMHRIQYGECVCWAAIHSEYCCGNSSFASVQLLRLQLSWWYRWVIT